MLNCLYKNKRYCSFKLKNQYGNYIFTEVKEIKDAGQKRLLKCEECGKPVILKAGDRKIPHFAHLANMSCNYSNYSTETEEHRKGKEILYYYFKEKYPDSEVMVDYALPNKRRANIFIHFNDDRKLAVEYQRKDIKIKDWQARHQDYQNLKIKDLWILSTKQYNPLREIKNNRFIFFNDLLIHESKNNTAYFLNTDNQKMIIVRKIEYRNRDNVLIKEKYYWQEYSLNDIMILPDGRIHCDFDLKYNYEREKYLEQMKQNDKLRDKKRFENNMRLQNTIINYQKNRPDNYKKKIIEELEMEAEKSQLENPTGPWLDSENNRWGFCRECGLFTKDWVTFDGKKNTCLCRECRQEISGRNSDE